MTDQPASDAIVAPGSARLAVLGSPIAHSQSPRIHQAAYDVLGLPWVYGSVELTAAGLEAWLAERGDEWRGLSLTMPLKEEAHRLAIVRDPLAEESGVANTLLRVIGGRWAAFNTDIGGLATAIRDAGLDAARTMVIGSGATAVSAILAARDLGAEHVEVVARNVPALSDLVARFGGTGPGRLHLAGTPLATLQLGLSPAEELPTLVVSTLPGHVAEQVSLPAALMRVPLFDVAYDPWPSPLAERWRVAGGAAHSGVDMLIQQALLQIRIFVGGDPALPLDREGEVLAAMRRAVVKE